MTRWVITPNPKLYHPPPTTGRDNGAFRPLDTDGCSRPPQMLQEAGIGNAFHRRQLLEYCHQLTLDIAKRQRVAPAPPHPGGAQLLAPSGASDIDMAGFVTYHPPHGSGEAGLGSPTTPTGRLTQRTHSAHPLKTPGATKTAVANTADNRQDQRGAAFPAEAGAGARLGTSTPNFGGALYPGRSSAGELDGKSGAAGGLGRVGPGGLRGTTVAVGAGVGPAWVRPPTSGGSAPGVAGALTGRDGRGGDDMARGADRGKPPLLGETQGSQLPGTAEKVVGALKSAADLAARLLPWPGNSAAELLGQLLDMTENAIINKRNWVTLVSG